MRWGFPYAFLLLLGIVPLILFLHSLRPKGTRIRTTALFLWERVLRQRPLGTRLGSLFQKNLLLILQLLAAIIFITALADPWLLYRRASMGDIVAVIDLSASMKAKSRSGSRFDEARKEFISLVDAMASDQKMMVVGAGPVFRILSPFIGDKKKLKDLARNLQPTDAPVEVKEAILFAHSFLKRGSHDRVVVFSDGAFEGARELPWHLPHLQLIKVEGGNHNVGIVGFEIRRLPDSRDRYEIMVRIRNFTASPVKAPLVLSIRGKRWREEIIEMAPRQSRVLVYPYQGPLEGQATVHLRIEDDFPTDNRAYLALSESPALRVLYAGKDNPFLLHFFRLLPRVQLAHVDRLAPESLSQLHLYEVIVLDGIPSPPLARGNFILINSIPEGLPLRATGKILRPRPLPSIARHPLMEGVRLDDLYIREALSLLSAGGATALAQSREGPLLLAIEKERLKALVIGFDLRASDFPFKVAFPVLLSNALDWFQPARAEFPSTSVQSGVPLSLNLPAADDQVEVTAPSGRKEVLRVRSSPLPFADTMDVGFYSFRTKSREGQFAVNLLSESESEISPRLSDRDLRARAAGREEKTETGSSLWPYLLVLVLVILSIEGFLAFRLGVLPYPLALRLLALSGIVLALANPKIFKATKAMDVILGVDFSRSVGQEGKEVASRILKEVRRIKSPETRVGLLFFGGQPAWEFSPRKDLRPADFSSAVRREETDIQAALQAALSQIGEGRQGRILLVSDGNENRGEVARVVPLLRSHGVPVWAHPIHPSRGKNEIYLTELVLPQQVDSAESFEVRGAIESLADASARVKLLRNGVIQKEEKIALRRGSNWVSFTAALNEAGSYRYELLVEAAEDTFPENNLLQGVVEVRGPPRVLYLHSEARVQRFFSRALKAQGYSVVESLPEERPLSLPEISTYDLVVLDNVPAYRLSQPKMETLEKYVRDLGGGLIVIGGAQSYGAGGYYRTPLERLLPVEMRPPARLDIPHVALLFVLDKSGSMGGGPPGVTKLDLAKGAVMAAGELLNPSDQVGILAFDAGWEWVFPFRRVGKGELISERLTALQSDGGTDLYKALVEAYRSFSVKGAAIKHLLVLSDGLTDKADFRSLVQKMIRDKITVSTVAVGQDADLALMSEIAREGKGRGYVTLDPRTIPQIFTTETLLISRDLLVEKLTHPKVIRSVGPLTGFSRKRIPPLHGYVLTNPKARADLLMKVEEDPLLVSWRYGLGRVIAFTSDLSGGWGKEWARWEDFPQWTGQLARSAMRTLSEQKTRVEFEQRGDEVRTVVDLFSQEGSFVNHLSLRGKLMDPDESALEKPFQQIAPGRYESRFPASKRGIYLLAIYPEGEKEADLPLATTMSFVTPYPREYRELKPNMSLLSRLAEESGGEMLDPSKLEEGLRRLFTPDPGKGTAAQETWWALSGIGLILFLADLALRRLPFIFTLTLPASRAGLGAGRPSPSKGED